MAENIDGRYTFRVVKQGAHTKIYLPDGSELRKVLHAEVSLGGHGDIGKLTLVLSDFVIDSCVFERKETGGAIND